MTDASMIWPALHAFWAFFEADAREGRLLRATCARSGMTSRRATVWPSVRPSSAMPADSHRADLRRSHRSGETREAPVRGSQCTVAAMRQGTQRHALETLCFHAGNRRNAAPGEGQG